MADRIQFRRDTSARWAEVNPILLDGEVGYVTDSQNKYKLGDGVRRWNDLPLQGFNGNIVNIPGTDTKSVMTQKGATDLVSEYNVSTNNNNAEYTFAQAVALVPASLQKGGITIKYIDSITHKYVVKRLISSIWNTTESNWQSIDDKPTAGSENLVTSGGVKELEEIDMKGILFAFENGLLKGSKISPSNTIPNCYIHGVTKELIPMSSNIYNVNQYKVNEGDILLIDTFVGEPSYLAAYAIYTSDNFNANNLVKSEYNNLKGYWCCIVPKGGAYLGTNKFPNVGNVYNIGNINTIIRSIETNVDNINSDLILNYNFYNFSDLTQTQQKIGFLDVNGVFRTSVNVGFICREYSVSEGDVVKIINPNHVGTRMAYAFYQDSFCQTLIKKGQLASEFPNEEVVVTPNNANYLVISEYGNTAKAQLGVKVSHEDFYVQVETYIEQHSIIDTIQSTNWLERYAYHYDGVENLYVAYNNGNGVETCYWFKKCMANHLYTFYRVGYRPVTRKYPSIENISNWSGITKINETDSDNIGPLNYTSTAGEGGEGFVGGNHRYPNESASTKYLTAVNNYYHIFVDNKQISDEDSGFAKYINVLVKNTIFDPGFTPEQGATSLSTPLCDEYVNYVICKNTIEVSVKHKYASTAQGTIIIYYGMQSMCFEEDYYITPLGLRTSWQAIQSSDSFTKQDYPNFNRFIEKKSDPGYYQSTYLYPDFSLGKHSNISNDDAIFIRSAGKGYHMCIRNLNVTSSTVYQWAGSYTFFTDPLLDNSDGFAYIGSVGGKSCLFVNTLQACELTIPIPSDLALRKFNVIENKTSSGQQCFTSDDDTTDFYIGGEGLYLKCSEIGSLIIQFD